MTVRKAQKLRNTLLTIGFIIMLSGCIYEPLTVVGIIVILSCFIPHFLFNKCPYCGKQLGKNEEKFCQFCGNKIDGTKNGGGKDMKKIFNTSSMSRVSNSISYEKREMISK